MLFVCQLSSFLIKREVVQCGDITAVDSKLHNTSKFLDGEQRVYTRLSVLQCLYNEF